MSEYSLLMHESEQGNKFFYCIAITDCQNLCIHFNDLCAFFFSSGSSLLHGWVPRTCNVSEDFLREAF